MSKISIPINVQAMIADLPAGLDRAILRVLSYHVGRDQAISRQALVKELAAVGFDYRKDDRQLRLAISQLRKHSCPICSAGGIGGGYYLAENWNELNEYLKTEVHARAMDLLETEKAMRSGGVELFGAPKNQLSMF